MDAPAYHAEAPVQVIRDRRGIVVGWTEDQRLTGKTIARDARGILVDKYDRHEYLTRNASDIVVGSSNLLPVLLVRP